MLVRTRVSVCFGSLCGNQRPKRLGGISADLYHSTMQERSDRTSTIRTAKQATMRNEQRVLVVVRVT